MKRRTAALLVVVLLCTAIGARMCSKTRSDFVATLHDRVDDQAHVLEPFGARIGRLADSFYDDLGIDIRIVTLTSPGSIESQANQVFQDRKIGATAPTGGLLILINPHLGKARIEVGYSLEGALTDLHMGRLARDQLAPYASYGTGGMAVMDMLHYLRDHVYAATATGELTLAEAYRTTPEFAEYQRFTSGGAGAKALLSDQSIDLDLKRTVPAELRARYAASERAEESVAAFMRATSELAGDPTLELFTEGSRMMRAHYPLARLEELQRHERIAASMPLEYLQQGDYTVATSARPVKGFVPILLHLEDGLWRVDLVETWKNLFFDSTGNYFLRNSNTPYAYGLGQFGKGQTFDIAPIPVQREFLGRTIAVLAGRQDALSTLRRGDLWLRNAFVFPQAYSAYEAARKAAPEDPLVLETLADRALYLGFPELAIPALEKIGAGVELTLADAYRDTGDLVAALQWTTLALKENAYDLHALRWQKFLAEKMDKSDEATRAEQLIATLSEDPSQKAAPVVLHFKPRRPRFEPDSALEVNGTKVFDHSHFSVTLHNTSNRTVVVDSVTLRSEGTAAASGLGDIKDYWHYPAGEHRLPAGESLIFTKNWGFTVDTGHQHVRYIFRSCWRGVETNAVRQCRTQWVDALPDIRP